MYDLIETSPKEIIEWTSDGTGFMIKHPKRLENEILHKYFRHKRSFTRQLSFNRFRKSTASCQLEGSNVMVRCFEYRHKRFMRENFGRFELYEMKQQLDIIAARVEKLCSTIQIIVALRKMNKASH